MTRRPRDQLREIALTAGAVLGAVCLLAAVAAAVLDVRPLVFRSGSMSPAIPTGSLALAHTVDADRVAVGDVVSVIDSTGSRVSHRVVATQPEGDRVALTLRGDANDVDDAQPYVVDHVDAVVGSVPGAGYAVTWLSSPLGLLLVGGYAAFLLSVILRRDGDEGPGGGPARGPRRRGGRRRGPPARARRRGAPVAGAVLLGAGLVVAPPAESAWAVWSNSATVTSGSYVALTVPPPTGGSCTTGSNATISWTSAGAGYSYEVVITRASNGAFVTRTTVTETSITIITGLLGNVLSTNFVATVRAFPVGAESWTSSGAVSQNFRSRTLGLGTACGHL